MSKKLITISIILILIALVAWFYFVSTKPSVNLDNLIAPVNTISVPSSNEGTTKLDLSRKGLTKLPADVLKRRELTELDISYNKLTGALPAEIHDLSNLKTLNASNNEMTGVPAEIGQLSNLEYLDLSNNKLTGLPYELGNLKKLKKLNLSGNNYSTLDLDIIKKSLPSDVVIVK